MTVIIRLARLEDAKDLLAIYRYYVEKTAITFEYEVPSLEEFQERMCSIMAFYPYLVAEEAGQILGYAYASSFHPRAAYAWSAEATVYLDKAARGKGVGRQIYRALEEYLIKMGILNLNACIASTETEDAYLTNGSEKFHRALGYQLVGKFHQSGYKFNHWYDMIWMEKMLGEHDNHVKPVKSIHEVTQKA
ncbi:GNAT family N-acetyltransferase [Streptococcus gallolyticus subsp. gallolyticus]|uniref:GNAT family N-acetyltransferase n=1 Tax=Streptococcus gallolyticus TaxID=315405 RepID=UPI000201B6E9|nr:GNAT family N-acetyltransferase [Streptococcus gallolyticus]MCY7158591.1 GNAT family N-acetyltransferase [Streptococcus gallolyticus subsp. gallolyticus]BAK27379.1 phosphinothricin acetyltransferase [Streptococcus gallolyticus subsp. gallolyticus ATCC 43143]CBZ47620.1 phosphinothricin acetyltransferase [Streptococcus gallolyticus subsp. gallolyticus ATCC BAA-2069]